MASFVRGLVKSKSHRKLKDGKSLLTCSTPDLPTIIESVGLCTKSMPNLISVMDLSRSKPTLYKTYFVANNGSHLNDGTYDRPFKSLRMTSKIASPGDTVYLLGGPYSCHDTICRVIDRPPTDQYITYESYHDEEAGFVSVNHPGRSTITIECDYVILRRIRVSGSEGCGISIKSNNVMIQECVITNTKLDGIHVDGCHDVSITNCKIESCCYVNNNIFHPADTSGITVSRCNNIVINHNTLDNNNGMGISLDHTTSCMIQHNTISECQYFGINVSNSSELDIDSNYIYSDGTTECMTGIRIGSAGPKTSSVTNSYINIVNNITNYVTCGIMIDLDGGMEYCKILGNTICNSLIGGVRIQGPLKGSMHNMFMMNIVYNVDFKTEMIMITDIFGFTFGYNNWSKQPHPYIDTRTDIIGDPQLRDTTIDSEPGIFRLMKTSPIIGKGVELPQLPVDFWNKSRVKPYTPGCYRGTL